MTSLELKGRYRGLYKVAVGKPGQSPRIETPWFDNLITDQGLDHIGNPPVTNTTNGFPYINTHCAVGTGTTPPTFADTQLEAPLAKNPSSASSNVEGGTLAYVAGPPAYWSCIWTYTFGVGVAAGNISEVGVGGMLSTDTEVKLFSRALIVDGAGNPTTITVLSDEILTVTYQLRLYLDLTDSAYDFLVDGVTYGGTVRRSIITSTPQIYYAVTQFNGGAGAYLYVYNGAIQSVTQEPSGTRVGGGGGSSTVAAAYSSGSYLRDFTTTFNFSQGNVSGGITAIQLTTSHGSFQFSVSPALPKDNTHQMKLYWRYSWSRYTP